MALSLFGNSATGSEIAEQIPRNALALLMVGQLVVIIPLIPYISIWIVAVCLFCGLWRSQVHIGRWSYPPPWVKMLLVVASFASIALIGGRTFNLEVATSLLVLAFALKLLEMRTRRDAYLVIYLCYFLIANGFLFNQSVAMTSYEVLAMIVVTAALVGLNQLQTRVRPMAGLWTAGGLVLQALPLTLVLFLLFPRVGPLWSVPLPNTGLTGLAEKITPGDVAALAQSDELSFRAVFEGDIPGFRDLYWRGLVYSEFESGTWSVGPQMGAMSEADSGNADYAYQIFLQPTQTRWLYALDTPTRYGSKIELLRDYRLQSHDPVLSVLRYRVESDKDLVRDVELPGWIRQRETALPENDNPRIRAYAQALLKEHGEARLMVQAMMLALEQGFTYTLKPPQLPRQNSIDALWFDTRAGFCSHFAGAVVFALRAAGIPARMVGGYQGGEINPVTGHMVVRQYLAHAWVEYWVSGRGWVRIDPTSAVAPERVESGLSAALSSTDLATLSLLTSARMGQGELLSDVLAWMDLLEHQWNLWVVGYDASTQKSVLEDLLGEVTPAKIGIAIAIGGGVSLLLVAIALFWRRWPQPRHPAEKAFTAFCSTMERHGLGRMPGETPASYLHRLGDLAYLDGAHVARLAQSALYDPESKSSMLATKSLRQWLHRLHLNLIFVKRRAIR